MTPPIPLPTHPPLPLLLRMPHVTTSTSSSSSSRVFNPSPCVSELLCTSTYPTQGPHVCPTLPREPMPYSTQGHHALLYWVLIMRGMVRRPGCEDMAGN